MPVNNAGMNMGVQISEIVISFPLDSCPEVRLLDYMIGLSFIF